MWYLSTFKLENHSSMGVEEWNSGVHKNHLGSCWNADSDSAGLRVCISSSLPLLLHGSHEHGKPCTNPGFSRSWKIAPEIFLFLFSFFLWCLQDHSLMVPKFNSMDWTSYIHCSGTQCRYMMLSWPLRLWVTHSVSACAGLFIFSKISFNPHDSPMKLVLLFSP